MKLFRIIYRFNSIRTDKYVRANTPEEAREKFPGDPNKIIHIEEVMYNDH